MKRTPGIWVRKGHMVQALMWAMIPTLILISVVVRWL
jgi:hypothetical protein